MLNRCHSERRFGGRGNFNGLTLEKRRIVITHIFHALLASLVRMKIYPKDKVGRYLNIRSFDSHGDYLFHWLFPCRPQTNTLFVSRLNMFKRINCLGAISVVELPEGEIHQWLVQEIETGSIKV